MGCAPGIGSSPDYSICEDPVLGCAVANIAHASSAEYERGWTDVHPELRFSPNRDAARIGRTLGLREAEFGFFTDPPMRRQYSRRQLEEMRNADAGFVVSLDKDGNGQRETYRTGFWRERSGRKGTFLAVFDPVRGDQAVITGSAAVDESFQFDWDSGVFMSWRPGHFHVANCNCPRHGEIEYRDGRLTVTWTGAESFE